MLVLFPQCRPDTLCAMRIDPAPPSRKRKPAGAATTTTTTTTKRRRAPHQQWSERVYKRLTERVDVRLLDRLLALPRLAKKHVDCLTRYREHVGADGSVAVCYRAKQHEMGRVYADNAVSLGAMTVEARGALCAAAMLDVDIVNAHPTLLVGVCRQEGWPCPALAAYVADRDASLRAIDAADTAAAKRCVLKLVFGGGLGAQYADNATARRLHAELRQLRDRVWQRFAEFRREAERHNRGYARATCLSLLLRFWENRCVLAAAEHLEERGWQVATLVFDGVMVYRRADRDIDDELAGLARHVAAVCGIDGVRFKRKPWDTSLLDALGGAPADRTTASAILKQ